MKIINKKNGITLISLVITIVIMLILAGVSIKLTVGNDGLFKKAKDSKAISMNAQNKEMQGLSDLENEIDSINGESNGSLTGKKALFVGDSVAYGHATGGNGYGYYINQEEHFDSFTNAAISSTRYNDAVGSSLSITNQLLRNAGQDYDYIIMEGGYNDLFYPGVAQLGSVTDNDYDYSHLSGSTTAGQLERTFYFASKIWPNSKLGFVITYKLADSVAISANADQLWSMVKKACDKWNISYIDLYSGTTNYEGADKTYTELLDTQNNSHSYIASDNLHPTEAGYEFICPFIAKWMKTLPTYTANFSITNGNIASDFRDAKYLKGSALTVNEGSYTYGAGNNLAATASPSPYGQFIRVKGGSKIGIASGRNIRYAIYEYKVVAEDSFMKSSGGEKAGRWIDQDITLNSDTSFIKLVIKNGNESTSNDFTNEEFNNLPTAIEYKN